MDTLNVSINSDNKQITWKAGVEHIYSGPFEILPTYLSGGIRRDTIRWLLSSGNTGKNERYHFAGFLRSMQNSLVVGLDSEGLILNDTPFTISAGNYLKFTKTGISTQDFEFQHGEQRLSVTAENGSDSIPSSVRMTFSDFDIGNLTGLVSGDKSIISAATNGNFVMGRNSVFKADLSFSDIVLFGENVFRLMKIRAENQTGDLLSFAVSLNGKGDSVDISGHLNTGSAPVALEAKADISNLDLTPFKPFFPDKISSLKGAVNAHLSIANTISDPEVSGYLAFSEVSVTPVYTQSLIRMDTDRIIFDKRQVRMNNFHLADSEGNTATINGTIDARDPVNPVFDLKLNTSKFMFLNTGSKSNSMFYGKLTAGLDASVLGNLQNPDIQLITNLGFDSEFYYVVPSTGTASIAQQGIVEFINKRTDTVSNILSRTTSTGTYRKAPTQNLNLTANISVDKKMKLTIIVDPASNESLEVQGSGNLSFNLKGTGQMTLAGNYLVDRGSYSLTLYDVLKRKFNIAQGSSLTWTGDVSNPRIDLSTWYSVQTSPQPVISSQMTGMTRAQDTQYSGNMDFDVYMYIKGFLMQPTISFEIKQKASERDPNIQAGLSALNSNESELNKQVFSLLLFNSFLEENTLSQNSFAYNLNSTARKGVGNILASQINRFSQQYFPSLNFKVNINSYAENAPGQPSANTNVQMNMSRELLNKRLSIKVGGNVNIPENNPNTVSPANINNLAGDVVVEYKLSPDGTYRIQAFKKNEYEDVLDGELSKTGVAFIFNRDFYRFKNLFRREKVKSEKSSGKSKTKK